MSLASACSPVSYSEDFDRQVRVPTTGTWTWVPLSSAQVQSLAAINPFLQRRIERAVEREFDSRGFTLVPDGRSDFLVSAYPILPERRSVTTTARRARAPVNVSVGVGVGFGRPRGWGRPSGYGGWGRPVGFRGWNWWSWGWGWGFPYYGNPYFGWTPGVGYAVVSTGGYGRRSVIGSGDRGPGTLVIDVIDSGSGEVVWQGLADGALLDMPPADELDDFIDRVVGRTLQGFPPEAGY